MRIGQAFKEYALFMKKPFEEEVVLVWKYWWKQIIPRQLCEVRSGGQPSFWMEFEALSC